MDITLITVGKLKEKYLIKGIQEYAKRLGRYTSFKIVEVADEKAPENLSKIEMKQIMEKEGQKILNKIPVNSHVFALAIDGKEQTSEKFAKELEQLMLYGKSKMVFIIGGSLGLSDEVLKRSDAQLSFGKLTFPHQLMRLILTEQIYRAFRIIRHEPYHK